VMNSLFSMESSDYNSILLFLSQPPPFPLTSEQLQIQKHSKFYVARNNLLYKIDKRNSNNLLRVLRKYELDPVLYIFHHDPLAAHFATDNMFEKIRNRYYWP